MHHIQLVTVVCFAYICVPVHVSKIEIDNYDEYMIVCILINTIVGTLSIKEFGNRKFIEAYLQASCQQHKQNTKQHDILGF